MDIESSLLAAKGEEVEGGLEWKAGVSRCKLLYIEWIAFSNFLNHFCVSNRSLSNYTQIHSTLFLFLIFFLIFAMLCWFLPYNNADQP